MLVIVILANGPLQHIVQPIAFGATLDLNPLAVLVLTIGGGCLFGMVGMILAAPLASAAVHVSRDLARARTARRAAPGARGRRGRAADDGLMGDPRRRRGSSQSDDAAGPPRALSWHGRRADPPARSTGVRRGPRRGFEAGAPACGHGPRHDGRAMTAARGPAASPGWATRASSSTSTGCGCSPTRCSTRVAHLRRVVPRPGDPGGGRRVLLSHLHRDHAHLRSLSRVARGRPVLAPAGSAALLARAGAAEVIEMAPGDEVAASARWRCARCTPITTAGAARIAARRRARLRRLRLADACTSPATPTSSRHGGPRARPRRRPAAHLGLGADAGRRPPRSAPGGRGARAAAAPARDPDPLGHLRPGRDVAGRSGGRSSPARRTTSCAPPAAWRPTCRCGCSRPAAPPGSSRRDAGRARRAPGGQRPPWPQVVGRAWSLLAINALGVYIGAAILPGVGLEGPGALIGVLLIAVINALLCPTLARLRAADQRPHPRASAASC